MKKKSLIIGIGVVVIIFVLLFAIKPWGNKPFKHVLDDEISSVSVELYPTIAFDLTKDEVAEFTEILRNVVVYSKDSSDEPLAGDAPTYTITKKDGATIAVIPCNPFFIIDGVRYKSQYQPCYELAGFATQVYDDNK